MITAQNNIYNSDKPLKILNFYSDGCPPCHAFMPNFIAAEKTFGKDMDFIVINTNQNIQLASNFNVRGTPTIIIMKNQEIIYNKAGVPNGAELKSIIIDLIGKNTPNDSIVKKKLFGLF